MKLTVYLFIILLLICQGCKNENKESIEAHLLRQEGILGEVLSNPDKYEYQISGTLISKNRSKKLANIDFRLGSNKSYFYPASTVKLPVAIFALEVLNDRGDIALDTPYTLDGDTTVYTVRKDIQEIFAVSGNAPYNRLFDLVGVDNINKRLAQIGLYDSRITHKLSEQAHRKFQSSTLVFSDSIEIHHDYRDPQSFEPIELEGTMKGEAYIKDSLVIETPFDFSRKNCVPLSDFHKLMKMLYLDSENKLKLDPDNMVYLKDVMSILPREAGYNSSYYDSYGKFFVYGDSKEKIPAYESIHNKVGYAYGTLTDVAYIENKETSTSFILCATILVNENGIFNDDNYEYDTIGIPFLAELGRTVYKYLDAYK